jgi:hypothetical protein
MKKIKSITVLLFSIALLSCESSTYEEISGVVENPTYTKNIKPIFDSKCVTCHYTGNSEGLSSFTNYTETKQGVQSGSVLYYIDTLGTMPKNSSKLSNETIKTIYKWKANGYPEN